MQVDREQLLRKVAEQFKVDLDLCRALTYLDSGDKGALVGFLKAQRQVLSEVELERSEGNDVYRAQGGVKALRQLESKLVAIIDKLEEATDVRS